MATGSRNKTVKLWDIRTGECYRTLTGHTEVVFCVALSADGATLASGTMDRTIKVWAIWILVKGVAGSDDHIDISNVTIVEAGVYS